MKLPPVVFFIYPTHLYCQEFTLYQWSRILLIFLGGLGEGLEGEGGEQEQEALEFGYLLDFQQERLVARGQ